MLRKPQARAIKFPLGRRARAEDSECFDFGHELLKGFLGVAEEHAGLGDVEKSVFDAGEAGAATQSITQYNSLAQCGARPA